MTSRARHVAEGEGGSEPGFRGGRASVRVGDSSLPTCQNVLYKAQDRPAAKPGMRSFCHLVRLSCTDSIGCRADIVDCNLLAGHSRTCREMLYPSFPGDVHKRYARDLRPRVSVSTQSCASHWHIERSHDLVTSRHNLNCLFNKHALWKNS